jgi:hypothetical protein
MAHPASAVAAVLLGLLVASPALARTAAKPPAGGRLACAPPFGSATSHAEVVAAFGKTDVTFEKVQVGEGEAIGATVVFPGDPARRIEIFWTDEKRRSGLANLRLSTETTWIAPNGLARGMAIAEVEKRNGRPFALSGFFWDYAGYVIGWNGGALDAPLPGGCKVDVRFDLPADAPEAATSAINGDTEFSSDDENMRAAKPFVSILGFGYPRP